MAKTYERSWISMGLEVGVASLDDESGDSVALRLAGPDGLPIAYVMDAAEAREVARELIAMADKVDPSETSKRERPGGG